MSCVLLEHVKHGSMKIWYINIYNIYRSFFLRGRAPEICLSSTLLKTTGERGIFFGTTFSWNVKSAKLKRIFSGSASSLSKYYSIQQVKDCFEERKLIRTQSMTRQQQSESESPLARGSDQGTRVSRVARVSVSQDSPEKIVNMETRAVLSREAERNIVDTLKRGLVL